ncbi:MAG: tripartite tricarboxylate transporter substrate binding protein [Candidatus Methylomirabilota bacterium]
MRRMIEMLGVVVVAVLAAAGAGAAAGFPEKPITLIVQSSAGGGSDIFARTLAAVVEREKLLPQPIVVENKAGGSGAIAYAYVAGKRKDPYFLLTCTPSFLTVPIVRKSQVTPKDFTPIANFAFDDFIVVVRQDSRFKRLADLVAEAKANPKKIAAGGTQVGGSDSISLYLIEKAAGIQFNYISFTGGGELNAALLGGHVDLVMLNPGEALELAKAQKVRILGVMADKRLAGAPEVPTLKEQGVDAVFRQHRGVVAPAELPTEARTVLETAMQQYTRTAGYRKYIADNVLSAAYMDGAAFGAWMGRESARYQEILVSMGLVKK